MKDHGEKRGYVQVYTGECKGKTTAALGLAFRAAGHGLKTYIGQFMKGQEYGELKSAQMMEPLITIEQYGKESMVDPGVLPETANVIMAKAGLDLCKKAMLSGSYDIVVFDEICYACFFRLINLKEIIEVIKAKPPAVEVILTGRYAPKELIALADLVTEMKEVKHYFRDGVMAREGIEN
ncbi:cob(I)yrinic acid a,c-diamide adenosyltransferase [Candidatus Formimonas warabiya]|uniref:Cob(I)yrinic acid a,c-diamide adenosyltransferase n=1 Tax=Formimonas warabiya TaxID=1761012 RepID=A0A3G1KYK9_FORW1|nr:cob(I)yrinic acid a,c-diamide adenosyltransferase [Candidatus Formimonas warabiya]ATW27574.1 cob(I)yrinic acid a,c-diamide adenosyltransferase [Candidatus Formimonas warabiya]